MRHRLIVLSVVGVLIAAPPSANAHISAAPETRVAAQPSPVSKNQPPLKPGAAAGIRAAQGVSDRGVLIASGLILASIVAALLLIEDDDDTSSTGTD